VVALALLGACQPAGPSVSASPTPQLTPHASVVPAAQNRALGLGEPREPEPFTIEQRLLDAVRRGDQTTIERTLERGASIHAKDDLARSVVLLAVMDADDLALVRWLHGKGAALDEPDASGRAALSFAAANGRLEMVRYLVDNRAAVDRRDVQQRTPLFHAAASDHGDAVALLISRGADVNARDQFGDTPLMVACAKGYAATAAVLLGHGADPSLKDQEGRTAKERSAPGIEPCQRAGAPAPAPRVAPS
jgi:hypothetical protein